ncbi:MAG TPA: cadherin-like beta sandwich domain-containing protein, partial [Chitinophagaceae bacterium]|nr:cadherin-like beta sandwich domain-containing protein [Chitinophagaceae bacterium]
GNGDSRAVFIAATADGSPNPVNGGNYYPDNTFGNGDSAGNWYEVYDSNYSGRQTLTVKGLSSSTAYRVMVVEYNGGQISSPAYLTTTVTDNPVNFTTTADASLSNLGVSSGTLNGSFSSTTFNYTDSVTNVTNNINITPTAADPNAVITVNGATVSSGSASGDIALNVGDNAIAIVVTSSDHLTIDTTTVIVKRADVPPVFGYAGPQVYSPNVAITSLAPTGSAGTVGTPGSNYQYNVGSGFDTPHGIALDAAGNIYVADSQHNAIKKIPADGSATISLNSSFNYPCGVAVDASGNIYIAGYNDDQVWEMAADGSNKRALGSGFKRPQGVAVDASGNVYVSDSQNH